jgi:hypothetical protein
MKKEVSGGSSQEVISTGSVENKKGRDYITTPKLD